MHSSDPTEAVMASLGAIWLLIALFVLGIFALQVIMNWQIAKKAGYDGALSLLMLIPVVNVVIMLMFAFGDWPVQQELRAWRNSAAAAVQPPPPPPGSSVMTT